MTTSKATPGQVGVRAEAHAGSLALAGNGSDAAAALTSIGFVAHDARTPSRVSRRWKVRRLLAHADPDVPAVCVIIPVRNGADTVADTLRSLQRQSVRRWQALVVDDGSSDDTVAAVQALCAADGRIRCLQQLASGVSAARNRGLDAAKTPWVMFLDADDWIAPDYLEHMLAALATHPSADVAFCGSHRVLPGGEALAELPGSVMNFPEELQFDPVRLLSESCPIAIHSIVVRRAVFERAGRFDESLMTSEDWDLWLRVARSGARFIGVRRPLAFYRLRSGGPSSKSVRIARDAQLVILRAHQPDPRLRGGDVRHAPGLLGEDVASRLAGVTLYFAGVTAGEGGPVQDVLDTLHDWPDFADEARLRDAARDIEAGLAVGARRTHAALWEDWERLLPAIHQICECIERHSSACGSGRRCLQLIEDIIIRAADLQQPVALSTVQGYQLELGAVRCTIAPMPNVDRLWLRICAKGVHVDDVEVPSAFPLQAMELALVLLRRWHMDRHLVPPESRIRWGQVYLDVIRLLFRRRDLPRNFGHRHRVAVARHIPALLKLASEECKALPHSERARADRLRARWRLPTASQGVPESTTGRRRMLAAPGDEYVMSKAQRLLALVPERLGRVLLVHERSPLEALLAARTAELHVVRLQDRKGLALPLGGGFDLIICYEILDRLTEAAALEELLRQLRGSLREAGCLVALHEFAAHEERTRSGFDRDRPRGAAGVHEILRGCSGLHFERSVRTELYRIDLLRAGTLDSGAQEDVHPLDCRLDPKTERQVIWGGAAVLRTEVAAESALRVPVLMYHSVAAEGPQALAQWRLHPERLEQQLRYFRRHGYHSVSSAEVLELVKHGKPIRGRPLMLTFDDGYYDFLKNAWPILRRYDFNAEVFLVTDRVGGTADWDRTYGDPAPLMSWAQILDLQREGVVFGSHSASHRRCDRLTTAELLEEAVRSREVLEARLERRVTTMAMPFGVWDARMLQALEWAGYELALTTAEGVASAGMNPLTLPRIEVFGTEDIETFVRRFDRALCDASLASGTP